MARNPRLKPADHRSPWQIEQGDKCSCRGADDYCACQNVDEPWKYGRGGKRPLTREQELERRVRELEGHVSTLEIQQKTDRQTIASIVAIRDRAADVDGIADALQDSIDMDWNSTIGARAVAKFLAADHPDAGSMIADLQLVRDFVESEAENRGAAGSDMSDYQNEAAEALARLDSAIAALTY